MNDPFSMTEIITALRREVAQIERSHDIMITHLEDRVRQLERTRTMSSALWCDPGNHAFSASDPDRRCISSEDADGNKITADMCGQHLPQYFRNTAVRGLIESPQWPSGPAKTQT